MYDNTPNKEYIDRWLEDIYDRYRYEKLRQMEKSRLEGLELRVESQFEIFKAGFPAKRSLVQGQRRAILLDEPNETKVALTAAEKERLRQAKSDIKHEIYRAKGYREEKRREHRADLLNSVVDLANATTRSILGVWATVKELTPW